MNTIQTRATMAQLTESINQTTGAFPKCGEPISSPCPTRSCVCPEQCLSDLMSSIFRLIDDCYMLFKTQEDTLKQRLDLEDFERHAASHRDLAEIVNSASRHLLQPHEYRLAISDLSQFKTCFEHHVSTFDRAL